MDFTLSYWPIYHIVNITVTVYANTATNQAEYSAIATEINIRQIHYVL